jgi:TatD DNase family protein
MLTDTHCHLYLEQFAGDIDAVIRRATEAGVEKMLAPGMDLKTSNDAARLAETHPNIFAAVGFHPTEIEKMNDKSFAELSKLAEHPKVVAIGEIGLDYYWVKEDDRQRLQRQKLKLQLDLAAAVNKPVILHLREGNDAETGAATNNLFELLAAWHNDLIQMNHPLQYKSGVFHSFNGNLESATHAMDMNFFIGFTGSVTYKKNDAQRELVGQLPLDRILIETDSPFQTPVPHRGQQNEPANVGLIADKIAEVHRTTREVIADATTVNASRLFGWEAHT